MPVVQFSKNKNYNASDVARRNQSRTVFTNSLVIQKSLENQCLNRVSLGLGTNASYTGGSYIDKQIGTIFTTPSQVTEILATSPCQILSSAPPPPPQVDFGSLSFPGVLYNQLYFDPDETLSLGAGDFTVEWYQYYDDTTTIAFPTPFAYGSYDTDLVVEVYFDNTNNQLAYYEQVEGGTNFFVNIPDPYRNTWCHFAICRSSGIVYMYQNGYKLDQTESTTDLTTGSVPLTIGNENEPISTTPFQGKITNFRIVPGYALYPGGIDFTPPSGPLPAVPGTQLLLNALTEETAFVDSSPANRVVNNWYDNVTWDSSRP